MKTKAIIPLILGLGIGIVAIKLFVDKLQSARASNKTEATVDVVTASTHINSTLEITESMLEVKPWPKHLVPENTFRQTGEVVGRVTSSPIAKGGFVSATLLAPPGTPPGMASRLEEGYRAVAIKVDEVASVGGWIQPGSKVDVICVLRPAARGASQQSRLLLQNVEVITVGDKIESKESGATVSRSVTLKLTPKQVAKIHLAATKGKLSLAMRNPEDNSEPVEVMATDQDLFERDRDGETSEDQRDAMAKRFAGLFGSREPKFPPDPTDKQMAPPVQTVAAAPEEKPWVVEVISGTNIYEVQFENDERNARRVTADARNSGRRPSQITPDSGPRRPSVADRPVSGATQDASSSVEPAEDALENIDDTDLLSELDDWPVE